MKAGSKAVLRGVGVVCVGALASCYQVLGLGDFTDEAGCADGEACTEAGSGGATASATSTGAGAGGGGGVAGAGGATTTTSAATGTGGTGGGGGAEVVCTPGDVIDCYSGPAGTEGKGICVGGTQTCTMDGSGYGPCVGEVTPQAETCAQTTDEDCDGVDCLLWAKQFPGQNTTSAALTPVVDDQGNVFVLGSFTSTIDMGGGALISAGSTDVVIAKLDSGGGYLWAYRFGDASAETATSAVVDAAGNVIVVGAFAGSIDFGGGVLQSGGLNDLFVVKLSPRGTHIWSKRYGTASDDVVIRCAVDGSDDIVLAGSFGGTIQFTNTPMSSVGGTDVYVAKLSGLDGSGIWSKQYGDASSSVARGVGVDPSDSILLAGEFDGGINFGGTALTSLGGTDLFVAKLDTFGNHSWSKRLGDAASQGILANLSVDSQGAAIINGAGTGFSFGGAVLSGNFYMAKFGTTGNHVWSSGFGSGINNLVGGLVVDKADNIVMTGRCAGTLDFGLTPLSCPASGNGYYGYLAKFSTLGQLVWDKAFGDPLLVNTSNNITRAGADPVSGSVLFGLSIGGGAVDVGAGPLAAANGKTALAKLAP